MNKKLKININLLIFLLYILFILINDYLCLIFKVSINIMFYIYSFCLVLFVFFFIRKYIIIDYIKNNKYDIFMFLIILMSFLSRITIPDSSFDTLNYHLYLQERAFDNNVSFNFFPARWINTFSLPLADRMHFFCRLLLGYRLGIMLNLFIMVIIYFQIKTILRFFIKNEVCISFFSTIIIITEQLLTNMITYYVDLFSIPLFLEIIIIIFSNKKTDNMMNWLVLFLSGILVSLKISNAFFIILLAIIYLIKFYKSINWKTFLFGIPLIIFPIAVYLINNYVQTGNPVFPFYNSIFKSVYLPQTNWIESFYGPKRLFEKILWPIVIFFNPRRAHDTDVYYGRMSFGYLVSIIIMIYSIYKKIYKKEKWNKFHYIVILYILLSLIWSNFMMGYIRYALVLEILSGIILSVAIDKFFNSRNRLVFLISIIGIFGFTYTTFYTMGDILNSSFELSWRNPYSKDKDTYLNNIKYLFSKNSYLSYTKNIDCFGIVDYNAGYASLLSRTIKIINLNEGYINDYGERKFNKIVNSCRNIYTISTDVTIDRTEKYLQTSGFQRKGENYTFKADFVNANNNLVIFEIEKIKE